ncbi:hypothetical protein LTR86_001425 [Recurvomyces mirabilis]|nr:hypothetical protein LTR86_001425 [Recurvomyces mirabilis]
MSNPSSPPRTSSISTSATTQTYAPTAIPTTSVITSTPNLTFPPAFATSLPPTQPSIPSTYGSNPFASTGYTSVAASTFPVPTAAGPRFAGLPGPSSEVASTAIAAGPPLPSGRKAKTHVASACVNCKRAHLSCDVQRPCTRCVASGKQESCIDVQHKKRGRPRLRDEGEFSSMGTGRSSPGSSVVAGPSQMTPRPIAQTRHRRAESFRSLRSQTSDDSSSMIGSTPIRGPLSFPSPYTVRQPGIPGSAPPRYEVATALLNTDFVIIRANQPFEQIMNNGGSTRGRHISELAAPADGESIHNIRTRLRTEREARDPAYMPQIMQPGQDPVLNISEADAEQYTQSFNDQTYTWRQAQPVPNIENFPARIRLAKAYSYFVVVTLPSFRPVDQPPAQSRPPPPAYGAPFGFGPPLPSPEPYGIARQQTLHSAPPLSAYGSRAPMTSTPFGRASGPFGSSSTYPPPQPPMPFQHPQPIHARPAPILSRPLSPRLLIREPPTDTTAFTPRSMPTESGREVGREALQLPPISSSQAGAGPSGARASGEGSSEDDDGDGNTTSPRKRRRMGIDEVLQR